MRTLTKIGIAVFSTAAILNLLSGVSGIVLLDYCTKPLRLSSLILIYAAIVKPWSIFSGYFLAGLACSMAGDILLMLVPTLGQDFFIYGLLAFLCAHLSYILAFSTYARQKQAHYVKRAPWMIVPFFLFFIGITWWWKDDLGELKIPVMAYSAVITSMGISATNLRGLLTPARFWSLLVGALLFILSDTLIAIDKFKMSIPGGHLWVMLTYIAAQAFLVRGALEMGLNAGLVKYPPNGDQEA
ncbi:MAG: lysoplasmalogenase [Haliscomenobacter sp.]